MHFLIWLIIGLGGFGISIGITNLVVLFNSEKDLNKKYFTISMGIAMSCAIISFSMVLYLLFTIL